MSTIIIQVGDAKVELPLEALLQLAQQKQTPSQAVEAPAKPAKPAVVQKASPSKGAVQLPLPMIERKRASKKPLSFILQHQIKKLAIGNTIFMPFADPRKAQWSIASAAERLRLRIGGNWRVKTRIMEHEGQQGLRITRVG